MACEVACGQPGRSLARKSEAESFAPVTLATPSTRPAPVVAGLNLPRPGSVSCAAKGTPVADARCDRLTEMPPADNHFTNSRREGPMIISLYRVSRTSGCGQHAMSGGHRSAPARIRHDASCDDRTGEKVYNR